MATSINSSSSPVSRLLKKIPVSSIVIISVSLFVGFGLYWWRAVYMDPNQVFESMLNNSLRLQGVTKTVSQGGGSQSMHQVARYNISAEPTVLSETTLLQGASTKVVTESIGTPSEDYVRYTIIETDQKNAAGQKIDFSSVLNVWGSGGIDTSQTDGELYNETVMGIVPFGNLTAAQRKELIDFMIDQNVYEVDYEAVTKESKDGRPQYIYEVGVDAEGYVKVLKRFADMTGLNNLGELNPEDYAGSERLPFTVTIDAWSRQLSQIKNANSDRTEIFSGFNASKAVSLPKDVISVEELQTRLQNIQ